MASIKMYSRFRDTPRTTDLCPTCFNPSLKIYILQQLSMEGIDQLGERVFCSDCKTWAGPLKEYARDKTPNA